MKKIERCRELKKRMNLSTNKPMHRKLLDKVIDWKIDMPYRKMERQIEGQGVKKETFTDRQLKREMCEEGFQIRS